LIGIDPERTFGIVQKTKYLHRAAICHIGAYAAFARLRDMESNCR
jgi:hypothetical protein